MKISSLPKSLLALTLGACLLAPSSSYADRKIKIRRDLDGDGHFNTKTIRFGDRGHYGYSGHRHYGNRGYGYGGYGYNRPSYYRPYGYSSYRYSRPYYGYGYGPSIGLSFYSQPAPYYYSAPAYYSEEYVTRTVPRVSRSYSSSAGDSLAADVQQALKRRGFYRGSIDGDIGPASRSAIRAYQAERGLTVTGRIDRSLLEALGIG